MSQRKMAQDPTVPESERFPIVGVGASAGGLEALTSLFGILAADTGLAFVVIQHLDPKHESLLPGLLSRATKMRVLQAHEGMLLEPNVVYVIPPNASMTVVQGTLRLGPREASGTRLPIDGFLRSLADERRGKSIAVILSGTGSDGTLGVAAIKSKDGVTFAQDEKSAKFGDMPKNAVASGCVDFVLRPEEIALELARIACHPYLGRGAQSLSPEQADLNIDEILSIMHEATGVDFSLYRQTTVRRRIQRRQALHNLRTVTSYIAYLREVPEEVAALYQDLLLKVTQFFRDPEAFEALNTRVLPQALQNRRENETIRLWVSGCASGEEAYSLAICVAEFLEKAKRSVPIQLFATDINATSIERARRGLYPESISADVSPERLLRNFTREVGGYRINKDVRERCVFAAHDLIKDPPYSRLDLITCRNVLIYMGSVLPRIVPMFHYALKPTGYLMLGSSESAAGFSNLFAAVDKKNKIYSRKVGPGRPVPYGAPAQGESIEGRMDLQRLADNVVLDRYGPARVIVDEHMDVVQIGGSVGPYLEIATGKPDLNLLKMVRGTGLSTEVHAAVEKAKEENVPVRRERLTVIQADKSREVNLEVIPLRSKSARTFLVLFDEFSAAQPEPSDTAEEAPTSTKKRKVDERDLKTVHLKEELSQTKRHLLSVIEAQAISGEEALSDQEEAQSNIEELQSLNEELETAKEELQSTNEELQSTNEELKTLNEELQTLNTEVGQSRDFTRAIVETIGNPLLVLDAELRVKTVNQAFYRFFQALPENTNGRIMYDVEHGSWDIPDLRTLLGDVLPNRKTIQDFELEREFPRIGKKVLLLSAHQLDSMPMILFSIEDITDRKTTERALRRSEEYLRQAQKMEAIGRLAGGVAHDFNNLLTGIMGYSALLLDRINAEDPQYEGLQEIQKAADRAAALTHQLLAFSRRQVLQPKILTLNSIVDDLERMLRRLIGEHIELVIASDKELGSVRADPGQIAQVIMNLTLNARDAMLHGGRLTIETRNVDLDEISAPQEGLPAGPYVTLVVSDTGIGIDPEAQTHLFEPFYTTKGKTLGTGLGLATVFGIVEQSGAKIHCSSTLGEGTSFSIYFPRLAETTAIPRKSSGGLSTVPRGSEVVLLAEDEESVRRLTRTFLENWGYKVIEARHGNEGLALCKSYDGPIHLLLTDVLMPEMGGRELAEQVLLLRPKTKVLLMSGYTDDALVLEGIKAQGTPFLQKPFTLQDLGCAIRDLLDSGDTAI
jgi:two-component system, chemotaxis family, CheB/CheR fusion protein